MTPKAKRKLDSLGIKKMADLVGRQVRLCRSLKTSAGAVFEAGSIMEVYGTWRGRVHLQKIGPIPEGEQNGWPRIAQVALWDIEKPDTAEDGR